MEIRLSIGPLDLDLKTRLADRLREAQLEREIKAAKSDSVNSTLTQLAASLASHIFTQFGGQVFNRPPDDLGDEGDGDNPDDDDNPDEPYASDSPKGPYAPDSPGFPPDGGGSDSPSEEAEAEATHEAAPADS